jgi:hypothetical protein
VRPVAGAVRCLHTQFWTFADEDEGRPWEFKRVEYDYGFLRRFYETNDRQIRRSDYPVFGNWSVNAIGLPQDVLEKLYVGNAQRLIPALGG